MANFRWFPTAIRNRDVPVDTLRWAKSDQFEARWTKFEDLHINPEHVAIWRPVEPGERPEEDYKVQIKLVIGDSFYLPIDAADCAAWLERAG